MGSGAEPYHIGICSNYLHASQGDVDTVIHKIIMSGVLNVLSMPVTGVWPILPTWAV